MCSDKPPWRTQARWELRGCLSARWLCSLANSFTAAKQHLCKKTLSENSSEPSCGTLCVCVCDCPASEFFISPVWFHFVRAHTHTQTHTVTHAVKHFIQFWSRLATSISLATSLRKVEDPHWATKACWQIRLALQKSQSRKWPPPTLCYKRACLPFTVRSNTRDC